MGVQKLCQQGGRAGLSRSKLDGLLLQLFSAAGSVYIVFPTTAERARCRVPKLHHLNVSCSGGGGLSRFGGLEHLDKQFRVT